MKTRLLAACAMSLCLALPAMAHPTEIGVSMALFDDNFLTVLRNGMQDYAKTLNGVSCRSRMHRTTSASSSTRSRTSSPPRSIAIIVNPVDTDATPAMTKLADGGRHPARLCQPSAGQPRHAAGQPGPSSVPTRSIPARWR